MRRIYSLFIFLIILLLAVDVPINAQGVIKETTVGKIKVRVRDDGHQGQTAMDPKDTGGLGGHVTIDFDNNTLLNQQFYRFVVRNSGTNIGVRNWTDTSGTLYPYRTAGSEIGIPEWTKIMFVVPEADGRTIHKYMRYQPPTVIVEGESKNTNFPYDAMEEVNPAKINTISQTADMLIESATIRTWIGLEVKQRVLAWSQKNHDDYVIYDMIFKNTGNIDKDDDIELPNNVLDSLYIMRSFMRFIGDDPRGHDWTHWNEPGDTLRLAYSYPCRLIAGTIDNFGVPMNDNSLARLVGPLYVGEATLFVSNAVNDMATDNLNAPNMRTIWDMRLLFIKENALTHLNELNKAFSVMKNGVTPDVVYAGTDANYVKPTLYPGTNVEEPPDGRTGGKQTQWVTQIVPWGGPAARYHSQPMYSIGPYHLNIGDSIRLVYAVVSGQISKRKGMEVAKQWYASKDQGAPATIPPPGCVWNNGNPTDNLPPQYKAFPALYNNNENDWAKDCWVATGKDSIVKNAWAAQWNMRQNYNIPTAPPPPSLSVKGAFACNMISWGSESEAASDFAGYRIYRAVGSYADSGWAPIFETTKGPNLVHDYKDTNGVIMNTAYFYSVVAFDDGVSNIPDFNGQKQSLESGIYANMTRNQVSPFLAAVNDMDSIRVVPNPYHFGADKVQYPGELNKIVFVNIPNECTIRIFTESGDLVRTIEHKGTPMPPTLGKGSEVWEVGKSGDDYTRQTTATGQRPVSGIYIAQVVKPNGQTKNVKFIIVR